MTTTPAPDATTGATEPGAAVAPVRVTASPSPRAVVPHAADPEVSFVIVAYGTGPILIDTIASITATAPPVAFEVIVVDNLHPRVGGRTAAELLATTRGVRLVRPMTNLGFGGGCELGALHARGAVLAFVNPDITFPPGWLPPLLAALAGDPARSIVAPVLTHPDGSIQEVGQRIHADGTTAPNTRLPAGGELVAVDYSSAACWLIRRREHERLGGFDPAYHPAYFEDVDLALRARQLGGCCVVHTGVRVVHHVGTGTPDRAEPAFAQLAVLRRTWPDLARTQPTRAQAERSSPV